MQEFFLNPIFPFLILILPPSRFHFLLTLIYQVSDEWFLTLNCIYISFISLYGLTITFSFNCDVLNSAIDTYPLSKEGEKWNWVRMQVGSCPFGSVNINKISFDAFYNRRSCHLVHWRSEITSGLICCVTLNLFSTTHVFS